MALQYNTCNGLAGPGSAVSVGAHSAIISQYKHAMFPPESDEKPSRGPTHSYSPGHVLKFHVIYIWQSNTTHAMASQALVARRRHAVTVGAHSAISVK